MTFVTVTRMQAAMADDGDWTHQRLNALAGWQLSATYGAEGNVACTRTLAIDPGDRRVVTAGRDGVQMWALPTLGRIAFSHGEHGHASGVAISPSGRLAVLHADGGVHVHAADHESVWILPTDLAADGVVSAVEFGGETLLTGHADGRVVGWTPGGRVAWSAAWGRSRVAQNELVASPDGTRCVRVDAEVGAWLFNVRSGATIRQLHEGWLGYAGDGICAWHGDDELTLRGQRLDPSSGKTRGRYALHSAYESHDPDAVVRCGTVVALLECCMHRIELQRVSGELLGSIELRDAPATNRMGSTHDGRHLICATGGRLLAWRINISNEGAPYECIGPCSPGAVHALEFVRGSARQLVAGIRDSALVVDVEDSRVTVHEDRRTHGDDFCGVAASGEAIAIVNPGAIRVTSLRDGAPSVVERSDGMWANDRFCAVSADGTRVAAGWRHYGHRQLRVTQLSVREDLIDVVEEHSPSALAFSPDANLVMAAGVACGPGSAAYASLWRVQPSSRLWSWNRPETGDAGRYDVGWVGLKIARAESLDRGFTAIAFDSIGSRVMGGTADGLVVVWDALTGALIAEHTVDGPAVDVSFGLDGTPRALSPDRWWSWPTGEPPAPDPWPAGEHLDLSPLGDELRCCALSQDGRCLAIGTAHGMLAIYRRDDAHTPRRCDHERCAGEA